MRKIAEIGRELTVKGESFVIAKVVDTRGSTPRKKGAVLLMRQDGTKYGTVGGGKLEAEVEKMMCESFVTHESNIYQFQLKPMDQQGLDMRCGGDADVSIEYIDAAFPEKFQQEFETSATAYIFGAGHVGQALEPVLRHVNFSTVVVDDRSEFANRERFPNADEVKVLGSFMNVYEEIEMDENSYVIIITRGHNADYDVLRQTLNKTTGYVGMIGSKTKVAAVYEMLRADGFTQEQLDRVYSPVGLKIFAETPEEIAISITAEMIQVRSGHGKR